MRLVWDIINGKYVEGFYIYARQMPLAADYAPGIVGGAGESYKMLTVLNGGGASTCTVSGLTAYTRYEFFVVPFYKSVEGKPSNSREARTMESGELIVFLCVFCPDFNVWAQEILLLMTLVKMC